MKRIVSTVIFSLVSINTLLMAENGRPELIVGIMVDQLRTDYLEYLNSLFGQNGFRRLINEGVYFRDVDFRNTASDPATATAVVYTGAWPAFNGLAGDEVYDESKRKNVPALTDREFRGIETQESYSPAALQLTTISDEVAIDGNGLGKIYSFSADPGQAVVMASHAGSAAVWLDENNGKWASSSYYQDFPSSIKNINSSSPLSSRIGSMRWKPALNLAVYPGIPPKKRQFEFSYTFPLSDRDVYRKFKSSALVNEEITSAAIATLKEKQLGSRGEAIDMINVAYTAAPFKYADDEDFRVELEDTYIRLDSQIARLLEEIENSVGIENAFIFLSSTGYYDDAAPNDPKFRIPTGEFSTLKAESLLNSYLSAIHGNGDFVSSIADGKVTLERQVIDRKGIPLQKVREEARDFLSKMSGVSRVLMLEDILSNTTDKKVGDLALAINPKQAADLYIQYTPGWSVIEDTSYPVISKVIRYSSPATPAFVLYPGVTPKKINETVDATILATTLTSALHIRAPNGASEKPLMPD